MCTIVVLRRPGHRWPLILGANRDEMTDRPWRPPGRHWPDRPGVTAGLDETAGGTWLGLNDRGVVAAVSNRHGSLGPAAGKASRGGLPLVALDEPTAAAAARAVAALDGAAYRAFNLVVADAGSAFWLRHADEGGAIDSRPLPEGLSMLTAGEVDDPESERIQTFLPRFRAVPAPRPEAGDWTGWEALLAARAGAPGGDPMAAMTVAGGGGFGTVSSSLMALPAPDSLGFRPIWRFAPGPPDEAVWEAITLTPEGL